MNGSEFPISAVGLGISTTLGAAMGAIVSALIGARSKKAEGAGALVEAASELTDRLLTRNTELAETERAIRKVLITLSDAVTGCLHEYPHQSDACMDILRAANQAAQTIL
jgi:hypothetical protein